MISAISSVETLGDAIYMYGEAIGEAIEPCIVTLVDNGTAQQLVAKLLLVLQEFTIVQENKSNSDENQNQHEQHCHVDR